MTASVCLSQQPDREKVDLVCVLFPSCSHSPSLVFNWPFLSLLSLSPHPSAYVFILSFSLSLFLFFLLFTLLVFNQLFSVILYIYVFLSLPPPAEALCLCQVLAWVACFHMEVLRRWYRTYVTPARWLGTLWRSHRVISGSENASTAVQGRRKEG